MRERQDTLSRCRASYETACRDQGGRIAFLPDKIPFGQALLVSSPTFLSVDGDAGRSTFAGCRLSLGRALLSAGVDVRCYKPSR